MTTDGLDRGRIGAADVAALASIGAGAIHAAAAGVHAENPTLSRLFVLTAAAQILVGLLLLLRRGRLAAVASSANARAVAAWAIAWTTGISWIDGLSTPSHHSSPTPRAPASACSAAVAAAVAVGPPHDDCSPRQPRGARRRPRRAERGGDDGRGDERAQPRRDRRPHPHGRRRRNRQRHRGAHAHAGPREHGPYPHLRAGSQRAHALLRAATAGHAHDEATEPAAWRGHGPGTRRRRSTSPASPASAPSSRRGPRRSSATHCVTCRRSPTSRRCPPSATGRSATPAPVSSTTSTSATSNDDKILDPTAPESLVFQVDGDGARSCRRCSSPVARRSTIPSWSTSAGRSCSGTSTTTCAGRSTTTASRRSSA